MTDIQRAMFGDHHAAERLTERGVAIPCPSCAGADIKVCMSAESLDIGAATAGRWLSGTVRKRRHWPIGTAVPRC